MPSPMFRFHYSSHLNCQPMKQSWNAVLEALSFFGLENSILSWFFSCLTGFLLLFSCPVVSDSFQPHGLQHARPPCPYHLLEFAQVHVHFIDDAVQPSHPLTPTATRPRSPSLSFPYLPASKCWSAQVQACAFLL